MPDASPQQLLSWLVGLAAVAVFVNTLLGVAEKWRGLRAPQPAPPPGAEPITKSEFVAGLAEIKTSFADLRAEMGQARDANRDTLHALRDKLHEQQLQTALLQKALDNGIKYRVEQLEAKYARLEDQARAPSARAAHGEKSS